MVFESPQWKLTEAQEPTAFAYARSLLTVTACSGKPKVKHINVPTAFFGMAEALVPTQVMAVAKQNGAVFFLEQEQDEPKGNWLFGFVTSLRAPVASRLTSPMT